MTNLLRALNKRGKSPYDFTKIPICKGFFLKGVLKPSVKGSEVIAWLKKDFDVGYGRSLVIYYTCKEYS